MMHENRKKKIKRKQTLRESVCKVRLFFLHRNEMKIKIFGEHDIDMMKM